MGRIAAPHGVRGALKVRPASADPAALLAYGEWWLRRPGGAWTAHRVASAHGHGAWLVAELDGVATRESAAALRGRDVGVPRAALAAARRGRVLPGGPGRDGGGESPWQSSSASSREFIESGAHPIARVVAGDGKETLIPWVASYVDARGHARWTRRGRLAAGRVSDMRIDVVTLFPEMVMQCERVWRDRTGARAGAVAARRLESARFRDRHLPDDRRPPVRRRAGNGDDGRTAGAGAGRRARGAAGGAGDDGDDVSTSRPPARRCRIAASSGLAARARGRR